MFCRNCGKEVDDNSVFCNNCGCNLKQEVPKEQTTGESKAGLGALLGVFLGIIGLIIGLCLFQNDTLERKTFVKGWGIAFGISMAVAVFFWIVLVVILVATGRFR